MVRKQHLLCLCTIAIIFSILYFVSISTTRESVPVQIKGKKEELLPTILYESPKIDWIDQQVEIINEKLQVKKWKLERICKDRGYSFAVSDKPDFEDDEPTELYDIKELNLFICL